MHFFIQTHDYKSMWKAEHSAHKLVSGQEWQENSTFSASDLHILTEFDKEVWRLPEATAHVKTVMAATSMEKALLWDYCSL